MNDLYKQNRPLYGFPHRDRFYISYVNADQLEKTSQKAKIYGFFGEFSTLISVNLFIFPLLP